jgi:hypothetical protein
VVHLVHLEQVVLMEHSSVHLEQVEHLVLVLVVQVELLVRVEQVDYKGHLVLQVQVVQVV